MQRTRQEPSGLDFVIQLVYERTHIRLHDGKEPLIRARLGKRQRALGLPSLADYVDYLRLAGDAEELTRAVDALTTNYTQFLREGDHFEFLVQTALPGLVGNRPGPIRVWSAACATGEEPYSIAFYLEEFFPTVAGWDWRILATDVSTRALGKAAQGIYDWERVVTLSAAWQRKYLLRGEGSAEGLCRVKPALRERIEFRHEDLFGEERGKGPFHVIFCRNAMIYFDRAAQQKLAQRLVRHLVPGGYLLIGHSESLTGLSVPLKCLRPSYYQRLSSFTCPHPA